MVGTGHPPTDGTPMQVIAGTLPPVTAGIAPPTAGIAAPTMPGTPVPDIPGTPGIGTTAARIVGAGHIPTITAAARPLEFGFAFNRQL